MTYHDDIMIIDISSGYQDIMNTAPTFMHDIGSSYHAYDIMIKLPTFVTGDIVIVT